MRFRLMLGLAMTLTLGCQALVPSAPTGKPSSPRQKPAARAVATPLPVTDPTRTIGASDLARAVTLIGKVKLISDKGLGIISNNSGGIISDKGLGLISNNGGGIISDKGLGYHVQAADARQESLLAEAQIEVLDAEGQVLMDAKGKPIVGLTDKEGRYQFEATLPKENLVLRVRLFPNGGASSAGGALYAMLPLAQEAGASSLSLDIDSASSLSAAYVLDEYVKGSREVYDRLPAAEAEALDTEMEAARAAWSETAPTYQRADLVAATEGLRREVSALDKKLEHIKEILLIGQQDLGNGMAATQVALTSPIAVAIDPAGGFYIGESIAGRIRKVGKDGTIGPVKVDRSIVMVSDMARDADGSLVVADQARHQVVRVSPSGHVTVMAGNGKPEHGPYGGPAAQTGLYKPVSLHRGPDGTWYFPQDWPSLPALTPEGILRDMGAPEDRGSVTAVASEPDGGLLVLDQGKGRLLRLKDGAWSVVLSDLKIDGKSRLLRKPDGTWLLSETSLNRIVALAPDGTRTVFAGTGQAGFAGDGGPASQAQLSSPAGMALAADGTIYVADYGNALVRAVAPDGTIRTVAGTQGLSQQGDVKGLAVNGPGGLALDPQGRLVVAESGSSLVKRLEGDTLTVIAGTTKGYGGDGGPATAAQLDPPVGLGYAEGTLFVLGNQEPRMRAIAPDGTIRTLLSGVRGAGDPFAEARRIPAGEEVFYKPSAMSMGPNGLPVWTEPAAQVVVRMVSETEVELVAGKWRQKGDSGDGAAAEAALLDSPLGLAHDAAGHLYVVCSASLVVRKIATDGTITTVAGVRPAQALGKLLGGYKPGSEEGAAAATALLLGPTAIAFDATGNMYVAEAGTEKADALLTADTPIPIPAELIPKIKPRIRKITPDGKIYTVAGPGSKLLTGEDGSDGLGIPTGLLIDGEGRLIIADGFSNQIKIVPAGGY